MIKIMLHVEGFSILALSLYSYGYHDFSWIFFFILLFAPDLSMLGYLIDNKVGAIVYNVFHTYTTVIFVLFLSFLLINETILAVGLIWAAHIGMDRIVGYGLKYTNTFKETHLNRV